MTIKFQNMMTKLGLSTGLILMFAGTVLAQNSRSQSRSQPSRDEQLAAGLVRKWGGRGAYVGLEHILAPAGFSVLKSPRKGLDNLVENGEKPAGMVSVSFVLKTQEGVFYISDWSWDTYVRKGKKPNWVLVKPEVGAPRGKNAESLRASIYENLKSDEKGRNCRAAYDFFRRHRDDPDVLELLINKYPKEEDQQAKSAALAILCQSSKFKHDEEFYRDMIEQLRIYRKSKVALKWGGQRNQPGDEWVRKWIHASQFGLGTNWVRFIVRNGGRYHAILAEYLSSEDMLLKWVATHSLALHGQLDAYQNHLNKRFFDVTLTELKDDREKYNATYATRVLLILKDQAAPHIASRRRNFNRLNQQEKEILALYAKDLTRPEVRKAFELKFGNLQCDMFYTQESADAFEYELPLFKNLEGYLP